MVTALREKEPREKERRGLPIGAWIGIAGAMSFGVAMAVMIAPRLLGSTDAPTAPAVAATTPVAAPTSQPVEAVVDTAVPAEAVAEVALPEPAAPEAPATGTPRTGTRTPRTTTSTGTSGSSTTASSTTASTATGGSTATKAPSGRFAAFADDGAGAAPIDTRATTQAAASAERGGGSGDLSADQIRTVVSRGQRQLQACWELAIRGQRDVQTTRMDVDVTIGASGTVMRATARGMGLGDLSTCIERNVRRWHFPPSGGETQTSFPVVFTGV